ncbi:hypothetical protein NCS56_01515800 [Fusarium sp. Ph1]|nr:hypothetical protein NCS56_01515800 [Fusarium sp. Ph1]
MLAALSERPESWYLSRTPIHADARPSRSTSWIMDKQQDPPAVACLRCRKQKLRCSRERPECRRCQRVETKCYYPTPPDRKRLALERARERTSRSEFHQTASPGQAPRPHLGDSGPSSAQDLDSQNALPATPGDQTRSTRDEFMVLCGRGAHESRATLVQPEMGASTRQIHPSQDTFTTVQVSKEVALFLFEIYFERHYQADFLFRKKQFMEDYTAGKICNYVVLATFAFASLFLPTVPGGVFQGEIDITEVSLADWGVIGQRWAEQAGQQALMKADQPCLALVQTCQVLALFWFAKAEVTRTGMHTAIAYRASRLLQCHQIHFDNTMTDQTSEQDLGMRCLWACWLTECSNLENSRFQVDCWTDVNGCPLPADGDNSSAGSFTYFLDKNGGLVSPDNGAKVGFNSVLIVVQGLWWEVQQFVRSVHGNNGSPSEWAAKYCSLNQRLEDLPSHMTHYEQHILASGVPRPPSAELSRIFSLKYIYELCLIYLHSSVVPVLSCRTQTPNFSRSMLRLAAEQAWEHSTKMTTMTEQYISWKAPISKLWPMVGYGAYVCAAVQLRRCLALGSLNYQWFERTKAHLHLTGELRKYWMTLQPLYEDMERQFAQAQALTASLRADLSKQNSGPGNGGEASNIDKRDANTWPDLSSHIRTYVANNNNFQRFGGLRVQGRFSHTATGDPLETSSASNNRETSPQLPGIQTLGFPGATDQPSMGSDGKLADAKDRLPADHSWEERLEPIWWNQDPGWLDDVFGSGFFLSDDLGFRMDVC